jgi:hypothetical protein
MSRNDLTRHSRNRPWRLRLVWLALAATGLATAAFAGADFVAKPDKDAMAHTITRQRVAEGEPAKAPQKRQDTPLTADQMFAAVDSYESDMNKALEHAESLRVKAYRSKDIIRMTCVDEKLGQMKEIVTIARPRFTTIKSAGDDELRLRSQFTTIREGWERVNQLSADMENCMGDTLDNVAIGNLNEEGGPGASIDDPTRPPEPTNILERPGLASPVAGVTNR